MLLPGPIIAWWAMSNVDGQYVWTAIFCGEFGGKRLGGWVDGSRWPGELNFGRLMDSSTTAAPAAAGLQGLGACLGLSLVWWSFWRLFLAALLQILKKHYHTTLKTLWNKTLFLDFWCGYERDWPACPSHCQRLCAPHWSSPWWRYLYQKASQIFERYSNQIIESDILIRYLSQIFVRYLNQIFIQ